MSVVICLAGHIGSGKTSVASAIAAGLECPRASFGAYVRSQVASCGGSADDRLALQEYGLQRVSSDIRSFCQDVLQFGGYVKGQPLVVDGLRHPNVYQAIRDLAAPSEVKLIYLQASEEDRQRRSSDAGVADNHPVEAQIDELLQIADVVVDASLPLNDVIAIAKDAIGQIAAVPS